MNDASLTLNSVGKKFGTTQALESLELKFEAGMIHGLIGPESAGKTTLMRLMAGLLTPTSGMIQYFSNNIEMPFKDVRPAIAYMPERQSLYADLSIKEHLDFFSKLYHLSEEVFQERTKKLLSITRLDRFIDRPAGKLSGGMYKKLGLICALLRSPKILLLDEPTNGVDPISRKEFWELLYNFHLENILIVVSTAYMDEAERCHKAHLLQTGKLLATGNPHQLLDENNVEDFNELFIKRNLC